MAIVACPECGKKMSSKAALCLRCGFSEGEVTEQQLEVVQLRRLRDKIYHLNMFSYSVMAVFLGGFGWFWMSSGGFQHKSTSGPFILMGLAGVAYLAIRVMQLHCRRQQRALLKKNSGRMI